MWRIQDRTFADWQAEPRGIRTERARVHGRASAGSSRPSGRSHGSRAGILHDCIPEIWTEPCALSCAEWRHSESETRLQAACRQVKPVSPGGAAQMAPPELRWPCASGMHYNYFLGLLVLAYFVIVTVGRDCACMLVNYRPAMDVVRSSRRYLLCMQSHAAGSRREVH